MYLHTFTSTGWKKVSNITILIIAGFAFNYLFFISGYNYVVVWIIHSLANIMLFITDRKSVK